MMEREPYRHAALGEPQGFGRWSEKLQSCRSLKEGWNGYTAPAPAAIAIQNAERFLDTMRQAEFEPTRLAPSAMGGVAITRRENERKVLVEFYNDGRVFALFANRPDEMAVDSVAANPESFRTLLTEMREFLDA